MTTRSPSYKVECLESFRQQMFFKKSLTGSDENTAVSTVLRVEQHMKDY